MILLLGGTSDTDPFIDGLHALGCEVCLSLATETELMLKNSPKCLIRGKLDSEALENCIGRHNITAIIDSTHPYATEIKKTALAVAKKKGVPYFRYLRPSGLGSFDGIIITQNHHEAAQVACTNGNTVLLTVGSKHVGIYAESAKRHGCHLVVRVLDDPRSVAACRSAGIPDTNIIARKGPFSVEENRQHIRAFNASGIVSKDSGNAGGVEEKIIAAQLEECKFVLVQRPPIDDHIFYESYETLLSAFATYGLH